MNRIIEEISNIGIIPVIAIDDAKDAVSLAQALCSGGLPCAEITFRTDAAEESIRKIADQFPEMLVGAGTVLSCEQADRAISAGAKFIVSPGLNPKVVMHCINKGITVIPGCSNPGDIETAMELGLSTVKFFPAEASGGIKMIKAMSAPYSGIHYVPTGGIDAGNLRDYLDFPMVAACGGSWMVSRDLIRSGAFDQITDLVREAAAKMLGFEVKHIGINASDEKIAGVIAAGFEKTFGFGKNEGASSIFAGTGIEIMKNSGPGANGHIAIGTNYIKRAVYNLEKRGIRFAMNTAAYDAQGNLKAIYLQEEMGGFAVHLLQK